MLGAVVCSPFFPLVISRLIHLRPIKGGQCGHARESDALMLAAGATFHCGSESEHGSRLAYFSCPFPVLAGEGGSKVGGACEWPLPQIQLLEVSPSLLTESGFLLLSFFSFVSLKRTSAGLETPLSGEVLLNLSLKVAPCDQPEDGITMRFIKPHFPANKRSPSTSGCHLYQKLICIFKEQLIVV